jgi:diguanylate cyclase (GGDEF)-like protein
MNPAAWWVELKAKKDKFLWKALLINNLLTIIIPIVCFGVIFSIAISTFLKNENTKRNDIILSGVTGHTDMLLEDSLDYLRNNDVAALSDVGASPNDIGAALEKLRNAGMHFLSIEIADNQGRILYANTSDIGSVGASIGDAAFFAESLKTGSAAWSGSYIRTGSEMKIISVAVPIASGTRIMIGNIDLESFRVIMDKFCKNFDAGINISLLDDKGEFLYLRDPTFSADSASDRNFGSIEAAAATGSGMANLVYSGKRITVSATRLNNAVWHAAIYESYDAVSALIRNTILLLSLLILTSIAAAAAITLNRIKTIRQSFEKLNTQTSEIAAGNYNVNTKSQIYVEFSKMAEKFRMMATGIKDKDNSLKNMVYTDTITGLSTKQYLIEKTDEIIRFNKSKRFAVVCFDIDNFKRVNDNYGHVIGDELLKMLSQRLRKIIPAENILARTGGDEFVLIVLNAEKYYSINLNVDRILYAMSTPFLCIGKSVTITSSIGISIFPDDGLTMNELLQYSDMAMYVAKDNGKNTFKFFDSEMREKLQRQMMIEQGLRMAIKNKEFMLVYQPQISHKKPGLRGFEALIRWNSVDIGNIVPVDFIPIAEETGLIIEIGKYVLRTACETIRTINYKYNGNYSIAVNISPVELKQANFVDVLREIIEETQIQPEWLELEITENVLIELHDLMISKLNLIRSMKVKIALDDFGTGYSSLSYLETLPVNLLKIDRKFIENVQDNDQSKRMVESIILMAHKLGIELIAEGIETKEQDGIISGLGCDFIQGYFISRPIILPELLTFVDEYLKG